MFLLMWTEVIIYQEVPNCLELNFSLCFLESGASVTTVQICPERSNEFELRTAGSDKKVAVLIWKFSFLTCLTCSPWLQILSSRSQRLAIRVFSSTPVMLTSPWPNSTASRPIFSTSIRFVCMERDKLTQSRKLIILKCLGKAQKSQ